MGLESRLSADALLALSNVVTLASDSSAQRAESLGFNVVYAEGGCFIDSECGGNIVSVYLPRELGHQIPKDSIVSVVSVDEDGNPLGSYRKCVTFAQFESVYRSTCGDDINQDVITIVRKYFNLTNSAWLVYLCNQGIVLEGNIMNKVIARLKELATPLKRWKDVLDVLKDYDFDEYKGLAVIPVGTKHTLAISPNGIKGARPSSGTNATILRLELFDGKVATEKALSDNYDVRTDREMRGGSLTKGLKEWLVENDVSSSAANLMAKKISIIYSALANGEKSNSRAGGGSGFGSSTSNDRDSKAQTELSLEDMSPINKNVLKVMKAYYPVKAVKGKIISATINGVNVYCSVVEQEACVEINRDSDGYQRVSIGIPKFPSLLPSYLQNIVRELGNNGREVYKFAMLFVTLLMYES